MLVRAALIASALVGWLWTSAGCGVSQTALAAPGVRLVVMLNRAPRETLADLLAVDVDGLLARSIGADVMNSG